MLHTSCSRCRARKARCDGQAPCSNCRKARLPEDACTRQMRKERVSVRRRQESVNLYRAIHTNSNEDIAPPYATFDTPHSAYASHPTFRSSDSEASRTLGEEEASSVLTHVTTPDDHEYGERLCTDKDVRLLLRHILISEASCEKLLRETFYWRCNTITHVCVLPVTLLQILGSFFYDVSSVSLQKLGLLCMAISLSIQYERRAANDPLDISPVQTSPHRLIGLSTSRCQQLQNAAIGIFDGVRHAGQWNSIECLQFATLLLQSSTGVDEAMLEDTFDTAVRAARRLGADRICTSSDDNLSSFEQQQHEEELVRCWWALVCRDWLSSMNSLAYTIHPHHFTTRLPNELFGTSDGEREIPAHSSWYPVRYSLLKIKLASLVRSVIDETNQSRTSLTDQRHTLAVKLESSLQQLCCSLPSGWRIRDTVDSATTKARTKIVWEWEDALRLKPQTECWLFYHQMFHTYCEAGLSSFDALAQRQSTQTNEADRGLRGHLSCPSHFAQSLASHILDLHDKVDLACHVMASMSFFNRIALNAALLIAQRLANNTVNEILEGEILTGKVLNVMRRYGNVDFRRKQTIKSLLHQYEQNVAQSATLNRMMESTFPTSEWLGLSQRQLTLHTDLPSQECSAAATASPLLSASFSFHDGSHWADFGSHLMDDLFASPPVMMQ